MAAREYIDALTGGEITLDGYANDQWAIDYGRDPQQTQTIFFPGCSFINFAQDLMHETYECLKGTIDGCGISLVCCGKILHFEPGAEEVCAEHERRLIESLVENGVERIITACPNCVKALRKLIAKTEGVVTTEVVALPQVLLEWGMRIDGQALDMIKRATGCTDGPMPKVTIHDSCPDRATGEFAEGVRALLPEGSVIELEHNRRKSKCCGSAVRGTGNYDLAAEMSQNRVDMCIGTEAAAIVTACMSCARILASTDDDIPVYHYLELLFGIPVLWKGTLPYMQLRFLFEAYQGENREFLGRSEEGCQDAKGEGEAL